MMSANGFRNAADRRLESPGSAGAGWLPTSPDSPAELVLEPEAPPPLDGAGILIVDEDPAFLLGLKTFVKDYVGFPSVQVARNGREALRLIREDPGIQVVTLDYRMPELDGLGVLERLREDPPRPLAVVMITGYPSDRLEEEFHAFGSPWLRTDHFVPKPVDFAALEPVLLRAYESLRREPPSAAPLGAGSESPALQAAVAEALGAGSATLCQARLDQWGDSLEQRLEQIQHRVAGLEAVLIRLADRSPGRWERFWLAVLAFGWVAAAVFLAHQMGWLAQLAGALDRILPPPTS